MIRTDMNSGGTSNDPRRLRIAHLPNAITGVRFLCAPTLLVLAWYGFPKAFVGVVAFSFFSDAVDGFIARRFKLESQLGARLDSLADIVIYATMPIAAWWLWPDIFQREAPYIAAVVVSYTLPALWGIFKFGVFTSYHTRSVKLAAALMGITVIVLFLGGPAWPFHIAAAVCLIAAMEEIAITVILRKKQDNIPSIWHVLKNQHR